MHNIHPQYLIPRYSSFHYFNVFNFLHFFKFNKRMFDKFVNPATKVYSLKCYLVSKKDFLNYAEKS